MLDFEKEFPEIAARYFDLRFDQLAAKGANYTNIPERSHRID
jgi:hypothetical protein